MTTREQAEAQLRDMAARVLELRRAGQHGDADSLTRDRDALARRAAKDLLEQDRKGNRAP